MIDVVVVLLLFLFLLTHLLVLRVRVVPPFLASP